MDRFKLTLVDMMEIPQAYEAEFLGDIAEKLDLSPLTRCIFTERLSQQNLDANWTDIVESCQPRLTPDQARKDNWSRQILPKLRELGFDHEANAKKLWQAVRPWLVQTHYHPWLWDKLSQISQKTQQMGIKAAKSPDHLGMLPKRNDYLTTVPLGSEVIFELQLPDSAHLTLLEREPNGTVVCLCPSPFAQTSQFQPQQATTIRLPQASAPQPAFVLTEPGKEQLIALLTPKMPPFQWLEQSRFEAMALQVSQLQEMFEYVKNQNSPQVRLLSTAYEVV